MKHPDDAVAPGLQRRVLPLPAATPVVP